MEERTVLITGASRGIGCEFVRQYAADGYRVIAGSRSAANSRALSDLQHRFPRRIDTYTLDVSDSRSVEAIKLALAKRSVDILINNAGIWGGDQQSLECVDHDRWMMAFVVNAVGPFRMIQAFRSNVARSAERKIILITSEMGSTELGGSAAYVYRSTKAAANRVLRSAAEDLKQDGILTLAIHPGWVKTDMGTPEATLTPEQSVRSMRGVIAALNKETSDRFVSLDGVRLPW